MSLLRVTLTAAIDRPAQPGATLINSMSTDLFIFSIICWFCPSSRCKHVYVVIPLSLRQSRLIAFLVLNPKSKKNDRHAVLVILDHVTSARV